MDITHKFIKSALKFTLPLAGSFLLLGGLSFLEGGSNTNCGVETPITIIKIVECYFFFRPYLALFHPSLSLPPPGRRYLFWLGGRGGAITVIKFKFVYYNLEIVISIAYLGKIFIKKNEIFKHKIIFDIHLIEEKTNKRVKVIKHTNTIKTHDLNPKFLSFIKTVIADSLSKEEEE